MDASLLIPTPDKLPAPVWILLVLKILTFSIHIIFINVVLGGSLIIFVSRLPGDRETIDVSFHGAAAGKIPTLIALGVTFGVAPLLFVQVLYGNLFYASSILMAVYWILIIPFLILAYYGAYIHVRKYAVARALSRIALLVTIVFVLYIGFMLVNNSTLMIQPEKWKAYFDNPGGTILNLSDPTLIPRYLHFVAASVAVGGLFLAIIWNLRKKSGAPESDRKIKLGLKMFGFATLAQMVVGFLFLLTLPSDFIMQFMGKNILYTAILFIGILSGVGAVVTALLNRLWPTTAMLLCTIAAMAITRQNLRTLYLGNYFRLESLKLSPQYGVLILFLIIFVIGLAAVWYMVKVCKPAGLKGGAR